MFSQDGHIGTPESGNFGMIASPTKGNGDSCSYLDVINNDITFSGIAGYSNGYQGGARYS